MHINIPDQYMGRSISIDRMGKNRILFGFLSDVLKIKKTVQHEFCQSETGRERRITLGYEYRRL